MDQLGQFHFSVQATNYGNQLQELPQGMRQGPAHVAAALPGKGSMKVHVVDEPDPEHLRAQLLGDTEQWRKWLYRKLRLEDKRHLSSCQWSSLIDLFDCHFAAVAVMDDNFWDTDLISFDIKLVVERAYGKGCVPFTLH